MILKIKHEEREFSVGDAVGFPSWEDGKLDIVGIIEGFGVTNAAHEPYFVVVRGPDGAAYYLSPNETKEL